MTVRPPFGDGGLACGAPPGIRLVGTGLRQMPFQRAEFCPSVVSPLKAGRDTRPAGKLRGAEQSDGAHRASSATHRTIPLGPPHACRNERARARGRWPYQQRPRDTHFALPWPAFYPSPVVACLLSVPGGGLSFACSRWWPAFCPFQTVACLLHVAGRA
jgi:hypothetical protein